MTAALPGFVSDKSVPELCARLEQLPLALELAERGVRVNAVVPGPFWTPAIATSDEETVKSFGSFTMMKRAGQPDEVAPCYIFLASEDSRYLTGNTLYADGGSHINGVAWAPDLD